MTQQSNNRQSTTQAVLRNDPQTQADPQAPNRDRYGDQETGATSGEVGDGRSEQQAARSGSQATQHSKGGSLQQDSERAVGAGNGQRSDARDVADGTKRGG
ncbi:hypothetical protein [Pseudoduganella chitinolytica]|uniref:Stress-induced protein n=1 Tax=Pseudoduganella chitinolytica TaxID=34070 RepID=A0ABY8B7T6_9BURK|nr:hypothetical protein [Pseudoduganella chitinolytica]WEF31994.1 hypothetical protein PX653_21570 [Pseudoduganella chitinolytica]